MRRKWTATIGAVATIGLFLLTNAKRLADAISIIHLPHDVGEFLSAMSEVPALISYGALSIGIICLAYLVNGSWTRYRPQGADEADICSAMRRSRHGVKITAASRMAIR
jgi:hypothetical protein